MSKFISQSILVIAIVAVTSISVVSTASARAGHYNVFNPSRSDVSAVSQDTGTPCYVEPSGFHSNIHWDSACRNANNKALVLPERTASAEPTPDVVPAPKESKPAPKQSKPAAKCRWTNVHCSGM